MPASTDRNIFPTGTLDRRNRTSQDQRRSSAESRSPLHIHQNEDEIFEVLEGSVRFVCEGQMFDAPVVTGVVVPKGARRTWKNVSETPVSWPFSHREDLEAMFEEFEGKELAELEEIARRYGTIFVGPPL